MSNDNTMSNIMNLAKLFAPTTNPSTQGTDNKTWPMFPLDAQIHTEPLRVCKSLIPYLPFEKQKSLSIFIKLYELMSVVDHFSTIDDHHYHSTSFRESETWQTDLLYSIKDNLDPSNAYWVDILLKINDVRKILASAQSGSSFSEPTLTPQTPGTSKEFMENISPMLDDSQKNMLQMLSTIMK